MSTNPHAAAASATRPRLAVLVTDGLSARVLMMGQLAELQRSGFEVRLFASPNADLERVAEREGVEVVPIPMHREPAPWHDLKSLLAVRRQLRRFAPQIVNASTPKAGLLGMLAAWSLGVPVRIYQVRGLRLETTRGFKRLILSACEWIAARCAHHVLCVSDSLRHVYVQNGLCPERKTLVLGHGSSNGVQVERFEPNAARRASGVQLRQELGIAETAFVVGFVGRLTSDKGIEELNAAAKLLRSTHPHSTLLLVGDFETGDPVPPSVVAELRETLTVKITGFVQDTSPYYHAMDVLAFPSHREGFPNVPLEAAAAGLPVVGFAATGTTDAVVHGVTGTLVPLGNIPLLVAALRCYADSESLRCSRGSAGLTRVSHDFRRSELWQSLQTFYRGCLTAKGLAEPQAESLTGASKHPLSPDQSNLTETRHAA